MANSALSYQYQPLKDDGMIRILTLHPGISEAPLVGSLDQVPIASSGAYEALSYVWADPGPPNTSYEIHIRNDGSEEGGLLQLRGGSLFAALRRLRLGDRPRRVWADQCCINQDDLAERSQQVQHMNRIYVSATHVLVWLGLDEGDKAAAAFSVIRELDQALRAQSPGVKELERHLTENQKPLKALADRAWFKRGWIVQEIGTSAPATMIWGAASINWDTLAGVCERLKAYHTLRKKLGISSSNISYLFRRFIEPDETTHHANRFNFVYELQRARHLQFTDDRDRVFAFLGHFSVSSRSRYGCGGPLSLEADYTKSVEETYNDLALQILRINPEAASILLVSVQHPRSALPSSRNQKKSSFQAEMDAWMANNKRLPSWVPDWRWSEGIILGEPICPHYAHGNTTTTLEIDEPNLELCLRGIEIDRIEICSDPMSSTDFYRTHSTMIVQQLWHDIVCARSKRRRPFNLQDKYPSGRKEESAFFAFMQTLANGCVQAAGHACIPYHEVPDHEWLCKAARYITQQFEPESKDEEVSIEIQDLVAKNKCGPPDGEHDSWVRWAMSASDGRVLARTTRGYFALAPAAVEPGDVVCVMFGCKVLFCLRPVVADSETDAGRYLLVGECYLHGFMKGEALLGLNEGELKESIFTLI